MSSATASRPSITRRSRPTPMTSRSARLTCGSTASPQRSLTPFTPSPRRSRRVTGGAWPSCSRSGRRAMAHAPRNSIFRRLCTSRPTGEPPSEGPMTTPESTSAARSPRRLAPTPRRSSSPTSAPGEPPHTDSRAAPPSGPTRRWRWPYGRSVTARRRPVQTPRPCSRLSSGSCARAMLGRGAAGRTSRPTMRLPYCEAGCCPCSSTWTSTSSSSNSRTASLRTPTSTAARAECTSASSPPRSAKPSRTCKTASRTRPKARSHCSTPACRRSRTRPRRRSWGARRPS